MKTQLQIPHDLIVELSKVSSCKPASAATCSFLYEFLSYMVTDAFEDMV